MAARSQCRKLTVGSLFAGIGGFDLGLERTGGFEVKWQVEIDEYCRRVLAKHWPHVQRYGDIRDVAAVERVDVLCGGFPCQPYSSAARGRNRTDATLWPEMLRLIEIVKPRWVIAENVAHINAVVLEQILSDMEGIGYTVGTIEIPACAVDKDHIRRRLWILGHADSNGKSGVRVDAEMAGVSQCGSFAGVVGAADGIPRRMDRLRAIGNAVVPQIVEWIGNQILAFERSGASS